MADKEILKRLEEIEARVAGTIPGPWRVVLNQEEDFFEIRTDGPGATVHIATLIKANWHTADFIACTREDVPWLCELARKLLAVAEAAREFYDAIYNEKNVYETWPDIMERQEVYEAGNRLRKALATLEEVEG